MSKRDLFCDTIRARGRVSCQIEGSLLENILTNSLVVSIIVGVMQKTNDYLTIAQKDGSPLFAYDRSYLSERARQLTSLDIPYGFIPRYAVKANSHPEIISLFDKCGLSFDASSSYEAAELIKQGIDQGNRIYPKPPTNSPDTQYPSLLS